MMKKFQQISTRKKRVLTVLALLLFVALIVVIGLAITPTLVSLVREPEQFRQWVGSNSLVSRLTMIGIMMVKVLIPIIPGKVFEIGAGYAFGVVEGTILCIIGAALGSYIAFIAVRTLGVKVFEVFYSREKLLSLSFLKDTKRLSVWVFFIMMVPGTPKDFISYFVGLTDIKFTSWLLISPLARIPVVLMSTVGGNALGEQDFGLAVIVFMITLAISAIGIFTYNRISKSKKNPDSDT